MCRAYLERDFGDNDAKQDFTLSFAGHGGTMQKTKAPFSQR
jgi:hypothetical protein